MRFRPDKDVAVPFQVVECNRFQRAFIQRVSAAIGTRKSVKAARHAYEGGYILRVGDIPTYSVADVNAAIAHCRVSSPPPAKIQFELATDLRAHLQDKRPPPLSLRPFDIRRIAALNLTAGEDAQDSKSRSALRRLTAMPLPDATPPDPDDLAEILSPVTLLEMRKLQNEHMTEEERRLPSFTRKNLQTLSNWPEWQQADYKQLDSHYAAGAIGKAVPRPVSVPGRRSQVFRLVWARLVKATGVRKSRACLDGSKRAAPWLRQLVQTYASCIELPCLRAFLAISAQMGYCICFGDVENAHQQSPPPSVDCFLEIDDTIEDWHMHKFNERPNRATHVIPLYKALQGHPEAGALWERMIMDIIINKMGFRCTTHERNLYTGTIDGHDILVCRQVDDFASASKTKEGAELFITVVRKHVEAEYAGMGLETEQGLYQRFNGIDVFQTKQCVKIGCESYIDRVLETHGWNAPTHSDPHNLVPISPSIVDGLMKVEGPEEKSDEAKALVRKHGFSYRNLLGELIYAYVICRIDIGFAICFLSRFATKPHNDHFAALRNVAKYLRSTKDWGIIYRRREPLDGLPDGDFEFLDEDPSLPPFPEFDLDQLVGILDASHATDLKTRRSVTGLALYYAGAAIAWKSQLQPTVSTSSTEAEFLAAVCCAKLAIYLRSVLQELGVLKPGPTPLLIDNEAAMKVINERRATPRVRHVAIQHFAIQEWRQMKPVIVHHLPGVINPTDDLTKGLSWILHGRHARRNMGHYKVSSSALSRKSDISQDGVTPRKAREDVGNHGSAPASTPGTEIVTGTEGAEARVSMTVREMKISNDAFRRRRSLS